MSDIKEVVTKLFKSNTIDVPAHRKALFDRFLQDEKNQATIKEIIQNQNWLMAKWKLEDRIADIIQQPIHILNATFGKPYESKFEFDKFKWKDITTFAFEGLEEIGLRYDEKTKQITGVPNKTGDVKFSLKFKVEGQVEEDPFNVKVFTLIVNPDPKSLWKTIDSDPHDPYWKEDNVTEFAPLNGKHILVSSKRGRSHANVGSFREDDFAFADLDNGWSIVVVADGAGSAKLSRKGSSIACKSVVNYFKEELSLVGLDKFDELVHEHKAKHDDTTQKKVNHFVYNNLGKAAFKVHKDLEEFASNSGVRIKDVSTTLIFLLFKKYDIGFVLFSFGVGDCPMVVLNKNVTKVIPLNWIDVGEFGGATRFITMPEVFKNEKFASRFGFQLVDDFSYLILMSDGIYDPKFTVEANLVNIKKWQQFLQDLNGNNDEKVKVELTENNKDIKKQFSDWMDFWSPGNHDDRTLAIVF